MKEKIGSENSETIHDQQIDVYENLEEWFKTGLRQGSGSGFGFEFSVGFGFGSGSV